MTKKKATTIPVVEPKLTKKQLAEKQAAESLAAEEAKRKEEAAQAKDKGKKGKDAPASDEGGKGEQEETEEQEEPVGKGKPRSLTAIAKAISKKILASAKASVEIGLLLQEGKSAVEFKHSKGAGKVFLEWAEQEFGIKKAQAYSYLKIAAVFGSEEMQEKFATVPMMVLSRLTMNDDMLDAAADAIEEGVKVGVKWMKEWMEAQKEEPSNTTDSGGDNDEEEEEEESTDSEPGKGKDKGQDDAFIQQLEAEIEELKAKLAEAASGVVSKDHFGAVALRMSKQEPYQVLGVAPDADKKAVKAAMRDLIKLYHPDIVGPSGAEVVEMVEAASKAMTK